MDVSVIMINYNTFSFTKDALDSIFRETKGIDYEVILIDNASPDGSGDRLSALYGNKIVYLQSGGNLGTSKAFNIALKHAAGKYVLWLNTDILLKENFIKKLFDYMESDPKCGICGGNLLDYQGKPAGSCREHFESIRILRKNYSILVNICRKLSRKRFDYNYSKQAKRVAWVGGADMMVRREVFDRIGGLDEVIFMYAEEEEFQYRMTQLTDYTVMSVPWAHMYHLEGGSVKKKKRGYNDAWERLMLLGLPRFFYKWYGEKTVRQYLNVRINGLKKLRFLELLTLKKDRAERHKQMIALYREYLANFSAYLEQLKGGDDQLKGEHK